MSIDEIQNEIVDEFAFFDDWTEKYEYIIDLGKNLPLIDEQYKDEDHLIRGCQSKVWLHAERQDQQVHFTADSDAMITRGIIAMLIRVLNDQPASDIASSDLFFIEKIGLRDHLSQTRSNGLTNMIKQMKMYGLAIEASK